MPDTNQSRWELAQNYEKNWWGNYAGNVDWYKEFAKTILESTKPYLQINRETAILEIGSGPMGAIAFLESDNKHAIEPLEDYFSTRKEWASLRDPRVKYKKGRGEELPYNKEYFDLIILDNVLDHCEDPATVLSEMNRVLKNNGIIFFRQNLYHWWGKRMRRMMEVFLIDKGHPFTFRKNELLDYFKKLSWQVELFEESSYFKTWQKGLISFSLKGLIKAVLLITNNRTMFILKKKR